MLSSELSAKDTNPVLETYPLPDNWKPLVCSWDNLMMVWEKLSQFPILFSDDVRGDLQAFIREMTDKSSVIFLTGDYGICEIRNIVPFRDCDVHLAFWDRRFKGRDTECRQVLKWIFSTLKVHRVTISIVGIAYYTINFIKSLGFKREGVIRESFPYKGKLLDVHIFGILESEAMEDKNGKTKN